MAKFTTAPGYFLPHPLPSGGLQNRRVAATLDSEQREALTHALHLRRTARSILECKGMQTPIGVFVPQTKANEVTHVLADISNVMESINRVARGAFRSEISNLRIDVDNSTPQNQAVKTYVEAQLEKLSKKLQNTKQHTHHATQSTVPKLHLLVGDKQLANELEDISEGTKKWELNASHSKAMIQRIDQLRKTIKEMSV